MFNAYFTYLMYFISCVVTREQLTLWPQTHLCSIMPVGEAGTAAGATAPLSLEVLGWGGIVGMLENSCQEVFSVSVRNNCVGREICTDSRFWVTSISGEEWPVF